MIFLGYLLEIIGMKKFLYNQYKLQKNKKINDKH